MSILGAALRAELAEALGLGALRRELRGELGDTRKAFAQRLGVSPGIVFAWESGRSAPRRKAIVARLQGLLKRQGPAGPPRGGSGPKRVLRLSTRRRAALKRQGQYMGFLRSLGASQRAEVKRVNASSGLAAAIKLARKLRHA